MNSLKMSIPVAKIFAVVVACFLLCFPTTVIAAPMTLGALVFTSPAVSTDFDGNFKVDALKVPLPADVTVRRAILSLPPGETGKISNIEITNPTGLTFGCKNIKVKDGIDLIQACGGPAALKTGGDVTYTAKGGCFSPGIKFSVKLFDDFKS
jgi:hypothetical protein